MSYSYNSHEVIIEPYCIFCHDPTNHVETRTFTDSSSTFEVGGGRTSTFSSSRSLTVPFPTHPECLRSFQRDRRKGCLLGLGPVAAVIALVLVLVACDLVRYGAIQESTAIPTHWIAFLFLGALVVGRVLWHRTNKQVTEKLSAKVTGYYATHVQSSSPPLLDGIEPRTLVVNSSGSGDYRDIGTAILDAQPGARILVQPGRYDGPILIDKQVEIVGDGPAKEIVVRSNRSFCFRMQTYDAKLCGLTIRDPGQGDFAIRVTVGRLVLEDCDISSSSLSCVGIHGPMSEAIVRHCSVHDSSQNGVFVFEKGRATVEDCAIFDNRHSGVAAQEGSSITMRRCQVYGMERFGIGLGDSVGTVEDCDVFCNHYSGVLINDDARAIVQRCRINRNKDFAVWASRGTVTVKDCDLTDNTNGAWQIEDGCAVDSSGNKEQQ